MKDIERRMKVLEYAIGIKEAQKRAHEPFVLYMPWNLTRNEHFLVYYPEGKFQKPVEYGPISYAQIRSLIGTYPAKIMLHVSMGECAEWLFAFHYYSDHSKLYTQEQLERFKEEDLRINPDMAYMVSDDGEEILRIMLLLPQVFSISMKEFQQAIKGV